MSTQPYAIEEGDDNSRSDNFAVRGSAEGAAAAGGVRVMVESRDRDAFAQARCMGVTFVTRRKSGTHSVTCRGTPFPRS